MTSLQDLAREATGRVLSDLADRQGIGDAIALCDEEIQDEIRDTVTALILPALEAALDQPKVTAGIGDMFSKPCGHNVYWQTAYGTCMSCRANRTEAERDKLRVELEQAKNYRAAANYDLLHVTAERDQLKSQLEQARKDDGRLTWLQFYGTVEVDIDGAWKAVDHVTGKTGKGDSIRTAIDLASQAEKEQG